MLLPQEQKFITYWEKQKANPRKNLIDFIKGFSTGLFMGVCTILILKSDWYIRADMEANSKSSPVLLCIIILLISVFIGVFYKNYKWEMNEQLYKELKQKA